VPGDVTPWPGLTGREIIDLLTRPRAEEAESRADPVLAGAVGRVRWGLGHVPAAAGAALLLAAAGLAAGLGYGLRAGDAGGEAGRMLAAGLAQLPAALAIAGVATAAFGLLPRGSAAVGWTAAGLAVLISVFGQVLRLPRWVPDVLPFTHVPRLPGGPVSAPGLAWLSLIAFVLVVSGLAAPRRRDIG
jgi:ABC-2 type transport system permease protein